MTDLHLSWQRMWSGLGAQGNSDQTCDEVIARYSESHRKYHSLQHLSECLDGFDAVRTLAQHPAEVEAALWFHDAIYDLHQHNNEEQSAVWARLVLTAAGVPQVSVDRIERLVLATKHTALPIAPDEQLLVDIDLSILGAAATRFAEYQQQIRDEYSFVPEELFKTKRREILQSFLDRSRIYSTEHFQSVLEQRARSNLRHAI